MSLGGGHCKEGQVIPGPVGCCEDFGGTQRRDMGSRGWGRWVRAETGITRRSYSSHPGERWLDGSEVRRSGHTLDPFQSKNQ